MKDLTPIEQRLRMANPIPDPANPPPMAPTAATALLELEERRGTMQTEQTLKPTTEPPKDRRRMVTAGIVAAGIVAAAALALWFGWLSNGSGDGAELPVANPAADPTIIFDEATLTCSYDGPAEFPLGVDATFTVVNASAVPVDFSVAALKPGLGFEDARDEPYNWQLFELPTETGVLFPEDGADPTFSRMARGIREGTVPDYAGTWLVRCGTLPISGGPDFEHAVATFEVVPSG